ncbi:hypothetical protein LINGRAPRIM_LOCUS2585, partial [Linum grandiflorum]
LLGHRRRTDGDPVAGQQERIAGYLKYINQGVRQFVSANCFNPVGDGHCGFRVISQVIYGYQERHLEMPAKILQQTILLVTALDGIRAPERVIYIVNTGNHWLRVMFNNDEGLILMPRLSPLWVHFHDDRMHGWRNLYAVERDLFLSLFCIDFF